MVSWLVAPSFSLAHSLISTDVLTPVHESCKNTFRPMKLISCCCQLPHEIKALPEMLSFIIKFLKKRLGKIRFIHFINMSTSFVYISCNSKSLACIACVLSAFYLLRIEYCAESSKKLVRHLLAPFPQFLLDSEQCSILSE